LYNKNGILGDSTASVAQSIYLNAPNLPSGASSFTINNSGFSLPAFVNAERPNLTLSGSQDSATQGETLLFFDAFGGNAQGTISMSKSGGGSICVGGVAGTVMTITGGCTYGAVAAGQVVNVSGVPTGTTVASLGTGTGGNGTYNLSASGTVAGGTTILTNDSPLSPTFTQSGNILGVISFSGWYGSGPATRTFGVANIQAIADGANYTTSGSWPASLRFFTTPPGAAAEVLRLTIGSTGTVTEELDALGTTLGTGISLINRTAAASGLQQQSPSLCMTGQGWKTNATAASQEVDWCATALPIQGAANPSSSLVFSDQINGGGFNAAMSLNSSGSLNLGLGLTIGGAAPSGHVPLGNGTNYVDGQLATANLSDVTNAGSWTPSDQSGATLTFTAVSVSYTKIGNMVFVYGRLTFPSTANGSGVLIGGLPATVANQNYASAPGVCNSNGTISVQAQPIKNATTFFLLNAVTGAGITNANMSTQTMNCTFSYSTT